MNTRREPRTSSPGYHPGLILHPFSFKPMPSPASSSPAATVSVPAGQPAVAQPLDQTPDGSPERFHGVRYLSDASYWCYLIHLPVVVFFQILVAPYGWHWAGKLALILLPGFAVLLLSYHYLVRRTWLGKFLNGRTYSKA